MHNWELKHKPSMKVKNKKKKTLNYANNMKSRLLTKKSWIINKKCKISWRLKKSKKMSLKERKRWRMKRSKLKKRLNTIWRQRMLLLSKKRKINKNLLINRKERRRWSWIMKTLLLNRSHRSKTERLQTRWILSSYSKQSNTKKMPKEWSSRSIKNV
jgi:uncharacterized membrane protein YfhO